MRNEKINLVLCPLQLKYSLILLDLVSGPETP
jgi:hypothetical protein